MLSVTYHARDLEGPIAEAVRRFRVVAMTGARQTGKSTLLRSLFAKTHRYLTLDDPAQLALALRDPKLFLQEHPGPVIIDEIQYAPGLLPYIKMEVDQNQRRGQFLLTGSQQFTLMKGLRETLAGRIALLQLHPFSISEGPSAFADYLPRTLRGSYPEPLLLRSQNSARWYASYFSTYVERDVQFHYRLEHPELFREMVTLLAARTTQSLNMTGLSNDLGISIPTIKSWIGILEASQLVFLLRPYHVNMGSRLVKTPKLYFNDIGLVAHLTNMTTREAILRGPLSGPLFENFVVQEAVKTFAHAGLHPPLFYYRTNNGLEVDLLVEHSPTLVTPIEIKLSRTPRHDMSRGIERLRALQKSERHLGPGYVVCMTDDGIALNREDRAVSWRQLPEILIPGRAGKKPPPRQI